MLNPEHDQAENIIARMKDAAARLLVGVAHSFDADGTDSVPIMDMEFRRNLILLYQEALNNIAKHSKATRVVITVKAREKMFDLTIEDDGVGFDPDTAKSGHGLNTLKHRAEQMGGSLQISSSPGKGTRLHLTAPIADPPLVVRLKVHAIRRLQAARSALERMYSLRT
jgi:signal transduction histidine kinase